MVELFSGSGTVSRAFNELGWTVCSVDVRKRKGLCEPSLRKDIMQLSRGELPENVHVLWASVPCDVWSYASGNFHWDAEGRPRTEKCLEHIALLAKTLQLIDEINPDRFFIENPRGRLRYWPPFVAWLEKRHAVVLTVTLSSYGFPTIKPTNLFTNCRDYVPVGPGRFGRGAKNPRGIFDNLSKCQRQKTPWPLAREVAEFCDGKISPGVLSCLN